MSRHPSGRFARSTSRSLALSVALIAVAVPVRADYFSLWTADVSLPGDGFPSSYVGDFDDDGRLEFVSSHPDDARLTQIRDLVTGQVERTLDWGSIYDAPVDYCALDVDGDGNAEILIPGDGGFRVVDWLPALDAPGEATAPPVHSMGAAHPNPFNPRTSIDFELVEEGRAVLAVYDPAGRLVTRLVDDHLGAGAHRVSWDGTDADGRSVASGTYFATLTVDGRTVASRKAVLLQ